MYSLYYSQKILIVNYIFFEKNTIREESYIFNTKINLFKFYSHLAKVLKVQKTSDLQHLVFL